MISIYYILSPLFQYFIKHPKLYYSAVVLFPLSLTMGRPANIHVGMTAVYYLPVYLMGMATCQFRKGMEAFLAKHLLVICSFFAFTNPFKPAYRKKQECTAMAILPACL